MVTIAFSAEVSSVNNEQEAEAGMKDQEKITDAQKEMTDVLTKTLPHFREKLGISQQALGEKIGVSRQTVSSIERGEYQMGWNLFLSIIYFLKVNSGAIPKNNMTDVDRFLLVKKDEG